jgi:hypothetical protein
MPEQSLLSVPSLASLVETEEQKIMKLPPAERLKALEALSAREPKESKWLVALIQVRTALKQYLKALREMVKLPSEAWLNHPELFADLFVCQVETKDWSAADGAEPRIPAELRSRPDVAEALRDLATEHGRRPTR